MPQGSMDGQQVKALAFSLCVERLHAKLWATLDTGLLLCFVASAAAAGAPWHKWPHENRTSSGRNAREGHPREPAIPA